MGGAFMQSGTSSFTEFLAAYNPEYLPGRRMAARQRGQSQTEHNGNHAIHINWTSMWHENFRSWSGSVGAKCL